MLNRYKENGAYRRDKQNKQGFDISVSCSITFSEYSTTFKVVKFETPNFGI